MPIVLSLFYPNMYGAVIAPLIMLTLGQKFIVTELGVVGWALLLVDSVLCFLAIVLCSESVQLENVGPVSLIRGLDVIYAIIVQLVLVKVNVTWNCISGSVNYSANYINHHTESMDRYSRMDRAKIVPLKI